MKIKCISCKNDLDLSSVVWKIGVYENMKSKEFICTCGQFNRYSVNVRGKETKIGKAITKRLK